MKDLRPIIIHTLRVHFLFFYIYNEMTFNFENFLFIKCIEMLQFLRYLGKNILGTDPLFERPALKGLQVMN